MERTILDSAGSLSWQQLGECVDDALRRQLMRLEVLRRLVDGAVPPGPRRASLASLHKILADRLPGYCPDDSDLEKRMNAEWVRLELPPFERQYRVRCGTKVYRLDLALPDTKIDVEWESLEFHGTRAGMDRDSDRRADLEAEGWHVMVFTGNSSPERIARAVQRAWTDRGGRLTARS